jgi:hypothetical protein
LAVRLVPSNRRSVRFIEAETAPLDQVPTNEAGFTVAVLAAIGSATFILFHHKRHPLQMGRLLTPHVRALT